MASISQIPFPKSGIDVFGEGMNRMFADLMKRQQMGQQNMQFNKQLGQSDEHFKQQMALRQQAEARAAQSAALQRQIAAMNLKKLDMETDPAKKMAYIQSIMQGVRNMPGHGGQSMGSPQEPPMQPFEGMGMPSMDEMQNPTQNIQPPTQQQLQQGFGFTPEQEMALGMAGIKVPKPHESPEQKRYADLQSKIELEKVKAANKEHALDHKEVKAVEKDLPTLEKSLKGVDELLRIAKQNPNMFGHTFLPDIYAKTNNSKDFGRWQNLISDAIAGLEQKLSSKGNLVALKMAAQLKPSHAEQQQVAIGKLESMREQLRDSINHSREVTGKQKLADETNGANTDLSQMSDEELMRIASGGQ